MYVAGSLARGCDSQEETRRFSTAVGATERARLRGHAAKLRCALLHRPKLVLRFLMHNKYQSYHGNIIIVAVVHGSSNANLSSRFDLFNVQGAGAGQAGGRF